MPGSASEGRDDRKMTDAIDIMSCQCSKRNGYLPWIAGLVVLLALTACSRKSTTTSIPSPVVPAAAESVDRSGPGMQGVQR